MIGAVMNHDEAGGLSADEGQAYRLAVLDPVATLGDAAWTLHRKRPRRRDPRLVERGRLSG